jgi:hypothetical protein
MISDSPSLRYCCGWPAEQRIPRRPASECVPSLLFPLLVYHYLTTVKWFIRVYLPDGRALRRRGITGRHDVTHNRPNHYKLPDGLIPKLSDTSDIDEPLVRACSYSDWTCRSRLAATALAGIAVTLTVLLALSLLILDAPNCSVMQVPGLFVFADLSKRPHKTK